MKITREYITGFTEYELKKVSEQSILRSLLISQETPISYKSAKIISMEYSKDGKGDRTYIIVEFEI